VADETRGESSRLRSGAAEGAPTAPHATPRGAGARARTGPERFWSTRRARRTFTAAILASTAAHWVLGPWSLLPTTRLDVTDKEGELTIDVALLSEEPAAPETAGAGGAPSSPDELAGATAGGGKGGLAAGGVDGGPPREAGADAADHDASDGAREASPRKRDAGPDAARDSGEHDGAGVVVDAGAGLALEESDGGEGEAGALALADAGPNGAGTSQDPRALLGKAGEIQAGKPNVRLVLNMAEIRKNPVGAHLGPLITAAPQWSDFLAGSKVDPVQHTEWLYLVGPSLAHTERDAVIIRYTLDDVWVDAAIDRISKRAVDGRTVDAGVPGVKVTLGFGDRARRAFVRPQPHLVAVGPPDYATTAAKLLKSAKAPRLVPNEAVYFEAQDPHGSVAQIPAAIRVLRIRVVHAADEGADVLLEGECDGASVCERAANELREFIRQSNSIGVRLVTHGVLNRAEVRAEERVVRAHVPVSRQQLDALYALAAGALGVTAAPPPPGPGSSTVPPP